MLYPQTIKLLEKINFYSETRRTAELNTELATWSKRERNFEEKHAVMNACFKQVARIVLVNSNTFDDLEEAKWLSLVGFSLEKNRPIPDFYEFNAYVE